MTPKKPRAIKDIEIVKDKKKMKLILEPKRAAILKMLGQQPMTVKQLSVALGKTTGMIMHHIDRMKKAGLIVQVRTERTTTGIVQRYYRATAKEYRLSGESVVESAPPPRAVPETSLVEIIRTLRAYGIQIPEDRMEDAKVLFEGMVQKERIAKASVPAPSHRIPAEVRVATERIMQKLTLEMDPDYRRLREAWYHFLVSFYAQGNY
ncbi:MAG: ArsR family transcriptional regulator [Candidatus Thorarchaeota archaeon]|nr:ArsR family transcriptional regulator [Candidatus Thorarchaeota archaeon]